MSNLHASLKELEELINEGMAERAEMVELLKRWAGLTPKEPRMNIQCDTEALLKRLGETEES